MERSGQKIWQVLPLTQVDSFLSPYSPPDSFAGNHLLIDLESLDKDNILKPEHWNVIKEKDKDHYKKNKELLLRKIFISWFKDEKNKEKLEKFYKDQNSWLKKHVEFFIEKNPKESREYLVFLQFVFQEQYSQLKKYANEKGILIFGDMPFYVNFESRDLWSNKKMFLLDSQGEPRYQSAVPPDSFHKKGQLWGTPVYDWDALEEDGFTYWISKIKRLAELYDYLRIDHFRGLESYYRVPFGGQSAEYGEWIKVPGELLLKEIGKIEGIKIIGENLGYITPEVDYLLEKFHIPGMSIVQFSLEDLYLRKSKKDTVYYTGSHDNQTLLGWIRDTYSPEEEIEKELVWDFIKKVFASKANWAMVPFQDLLCLDDEGRMNTPGTIEDNWIWTWDGTFDSLSELEKSLYHVTIKYNRS